MIPIVPSQRNIGYVIALVLLVGSAGAMIGGNAAAEGEERIDLYENSTDRWIEDGRLVEDPERAAHTGGAIVPHQSEKRYDLGIASAMPDTPALDRVLEQALLIPMLKAGFRIANVGNAVGYVMVGVVGVGVTKAAIYGAWFAGMGAYAWQFWRVLQQ